MLPLAGPAVPNSAESLATALLKGLAANQLRARSVSATGNWPKLDAISVDLSGTQVTRRQRLPIANTSASNDVSATAFNLTASPLTFEQTPIAVSLNATNAAFALAKNDAGGISLVPTSAGRGEVSIDVARAALETLLQGLAAEAAKPHGADIKRVQLEITSRTPREISFRAQVTAKMFFVSATVGLTGDVSVDDGLNAKLSNLGFSGEGMIGSAAGGFIRPQLEKLEGQTFPLMAFSLGSIKLRDIQLRGGESLHLTAQFGDAA